MNLIELRRQLVMMQMFVKDLLLHLFAMLTKWTEEVLSVSKSVCSHVSYPKLLNDIDGVWYWGSTVSIFSESVHRA
jgi:hypothetical protein